MNKEIRGLIVEILVVLSIMLVTVPLFIYGNRKNISERERLSNYSNQIDIEIIQNSNKKNLYPMSDREAIETLESSIIKVTNLDNDNGIYDIILKMNKINDLHNYKIMLDGKVYLLSDIEYTEDNEYRYFTIDSISITNKERYLNFNIWITNDGYDYVDEQVTYSFLIERNLYGL